MLLHAIPHKKRPVQIDPTILTPTDVKKNCLRDGAKAIVAGIQDSRIDGIKECLQLQGNTVNIRPIWDTDANHGYSNVIVVKRKVYEKLLCNSVEPKILEGTERHGREATEKHTQSQRYTEPMDFHSHSRADLAKQFWTALNSLIFIS